MQTREGWTQLFERAAFTYRPEQRDTSAVVHLDPLGQQMRDVLLRTSNALRNDTRPVPNTGYAIRGLFADFWDLHGGSSIFGQPLSDEIEVMDAGETPLVRQVFERVVLQRPVNGTSVTDVTLGPVGRMRWAQHDARSTTTRYIPR
jgi:hypothetical protein